MASHAPFEILVTREYLQAAEAILDAWSDPGPHPTAHAKARRKLEAEWPTLAGAIRRFSEGSWWTDDGLVT